MVTNLAKAQHAAELLLDARRSGRKLPGFPDDARPQSNAEAHAVQEAVTRLAGASVTAWKVGAPPGSLTTYAPMYATDVHPAPASIPLSRHPGMQVEGEVAFRLRHDLPLAGRPYSAEAVAEAVEGVCAAIEVGESRLLDFTGASIPEKIADNLGNGAFVYGHFTRAWRPLDLAQLHVTLTVNGNVHVDRIGGKPGDPPFKLLSWAADHLGGEGLKAGDIVTTGSWTGWYAAHAGDEIVVRFGGVGEVVLRCPP